MVSISKKTTNRKTYYYLEHSARKDGKVEKKEIYLGSQIPRNIEHIKRDFLYKIYKEKWFDAFDRIKKNHSKEHRLTPKSAKEKELEGFSIKFTYDSQRIEGSTLKYRETADLLERGIAPRGRPINDIKEAEAHQKVFFEMINYSKDLSLETVLYWHRKLLETTRLDIAGVIRKHQVMIGGSRFEPPSPVEVFPMLRDFFRWYDRDKTVLNPVELSAMVHLKFVTIHPFTDGNGRISRIMMNFILKKHGFPMLNIPYNKRGSYYTALERAQVRKQDSIFLNWFFRKYLKDFRRYLK